MPASLSGRHRPVTRAAVYVRISRDVAGQGLGVDRQEADCRALAERNGWRVAEVYSDNDTSASRYAKRGRAAYARMIAAIEAGEVDAVVVYSLDRLYRRPAELEAFMVLADQRGIALDSIEGEYDLSTSDGRLRARIKGAVGAHEAERTSERIRRAITQNVAAGRPGGGGRPYGYSANGGEVIPTEAEIVRECVGRLLAGATVRSLVLDLGARGVTTPKGGAWRHTTLRRMLLRPRLAGLREHLGAVTGEATWEPIITLAQHRQLVAVLGKPTPREKRPPRSHILTGLLWCGLCGKRMTSRPQGGAPALCLLPREPRLWARGRGR